MIIVPFIALTLYLIFIYGFVKLGKKLENMKLIISSKLFFFFSIVASYSNYFFNIFDYKIEALPIVNSILNGLLLLYLGYSIFKMHRHLGINSKSLSIFIMIFGFLQMSYVLNAIAFTLHIFLVITIVVFYSQLNKVHDL